MPSEPLSALCTRLETLAAKATPGPWRYGGDDEPWNVVHNSAEDEVVIVTTSGLYADARYLAALDPETVRRLVAAARAGEEIDRMLRGDEP